MTKEQLINLGVPEELAAKIAVESLKELEGYVEKSKFTELETVKKQLEEGNTTLSKQLEEIKKSTGSSTELKKQIEDMQLANKTKAEEYEKTISQLKLDNALEIALINAGAKNNKAVRALLDLEKVKIENEKLVGMDEQLSELKKSADYLFNVSTTVPTGTVPQQASSNTGTTEKVTLGSALKTIYNKN